MVFTRGSSDVEFDPRFVVRKLWSKASLLPNSEMLGEFARWDPPPTTPGAAKSREETEERAEKGWCESRELRYCCWTWGKL